MISFDKWFKVAKDGKNREEIARATFEFALNQAQAVLYNVAIKGQVDPKVEDVLILCIDKIQELKKG